MKVLSNANKKVQGPCGFYQPGKGPPNNMVIIGATWVMFRWLWRK
jgi:hypothetical protein